MLELSLKETKEGCMFVRFRKRYPSLPAEHLACSPRVGLNIDIGCAVSGWNRLEKEITVFPNSD